MKGNQWFMGNMLIEGMLRYVELGGLLDEMRIELVRFCLVLSKIFWNVHPKCLGLDDPK